MSIIAKYEDGVFKPLGEVSLHDGTIVEVQVPSLRDRLTTKSRPVGDSGFYGMWSDRADLGDSVAYINGLRRDIRG